MVDGSDQLRAFDPRGLKNATAAGQYVEGRTTLGGQRSQLVSESAVQANRPTVLSAIEQTHVVGRGLDQFAEHLSAVAGRAAMIASQLGGPYAEDEGRSGASASDRTERGPMSAVEALNAAVEGLQPRVNGLDEPLHRLIQALNAIERFVGA